MDDTPNDWLRPRAPTPAALPTSAPVAEIPDSHDAFIAWLLSPETLPALGRRRIAPTGDASSGVMLLTDQPAPEDIDAGALFSGPAGRLLDAMLAAIGLDRDRLYIASLLPANMPIAIDAGPDSEIARIARHHLAIVRPKRLLLMGDATIRALCGTSLHDARSGKPNLNHGSGTCSAVATFHPRFLLQNPAIKAEAWADLRRFSELPVQ